MFPAFSHFRPTATMEAELNDAQIRKGDKVVLRHPSSDRDASRYEDPDDVTRSPEQEAFGGGSALCLGTALARMELRTLLEETLCFSEQRSTARGPCGTSVRSPPLKALPERLLARLPGRRARQPVGASTRGDLYPLRAPAGLGAPQVSVC